MKNKRIIKAALAALTESERRLLQLLTNDSAGREDVLSFLAGYDIDNETAVSSFLINELLDRFGIGAAESELVPRIRGLKEYFRFQNAAAVMQTPCGTVITDADLYLKLRYPDEIRPFTAQDAAGQRGEWIPCIYGASYTKRLLHSARAVTVQQREYMLPEERYLPDLLLHKLKCAAQGGDSSGRALCWLYDMHRFCGSSGRTVYASLGIGMEIAGHLAGRIKRWLLK